MRLNICLAALAATLVVSPAFAQTVTDPAPTSSDTTSATARGVVLQSHQLTKNSDLDFGVVTTDQLNAGTVAVSAEKTPVRTTTTGVIALPSTFTAAEFDGIAAPGETVGLVVTPPPSNVLVSTSNPSDTIAVNSLDLDSGGGLTGTRVTNSSTGAFTFYVGGTFGLAAKQPAGVYTAQFNVTANYQ